MKKAKQRKKGFYRILAKLIVEGAPFDISKNDGGYKMVQELINLHRLRELSDANRHKIWNQSLDEIKKRFDDAITYINDNPDDVPEFRNLHVYKSKPLDKRNIQFLSVKVGYRKSKERNTDRLMQRIETVAKPALKEIGKTQPDRLEELRRRLEQLQVTKLLTG